MIRRIVFRPEAEAEISDAIDWYEAHGKGLGGEFLRSVEAAVANVARHPSAYPIVHGDVRRALLRRFPYGLIYTANGDELLIVACFHGRRDPQRLRDRIS